MALALRRETFYVRFAHPRSDYSLDVYLEKNNFASGDYSRGGSAKPTRAVLREPSRHQRVALQPTPARAAGRKLVYGGSVVDVPDFQAVESSVLAVAEPREKPHPVVLELLDAPHKVQPRRPPCRIKTIATALWPHMPSATGDVLVRIARQRDLHGPA